MRKLAFLFSLTVSLPALAGSAEDWLKDMSQALMQSNYRGVFVYEMGGHMEAMQITHAMREDGEYEHLLALTGHPREVLRSPQGVTCILPERKALKVNRALPRGPVPDAFLNNLDRIKQNYQLTLVGEDRVSGQASKIIGVTPRDDFRYGYRLWLTEANKLPVRLELLMPQGDVLERMMFTELTVVDELPDSWLQLELEGDRRDKPLPGTATMPAVETDSQWQAGWLPEGFQRTHYNPHAMSKKHSRLEHLVYSDGLATVSIYVESMAEDKPRLRGLRTMGATHAMGRQIDNHQVTVVGEVPARTIERITASVQYRP